MKAPLNVNLNRVTLLLILFALSAGVLAAWFAQSYVNEEIAAQARKPRSKVLAEACHRREKQLPAGTRLGGATVAAREVPNEFLHRDAIGANEWNKIQGRATRHAANCRRAGSYARICSAARAVGLPISSRKASARSPYPSTNFRPSPECSLRATRSTSS